MIKMTAVSLFAGVGGFDLALERNGVDVVASVEIDKHARGVLERRFPTSKLFNDVKEVTGNDLRDAGFIPERGIITGGFPCQDLSVAGKRAGFAGQRSSLFYEIARLADETKAKWLVLENVPGLLTSQRGADMGAVIGTLADLGYCVGWRVLDAQHFGIPQRRRRVFIVAERAGNPTGPAKVLFEPTSLRGDSSTGGTPWQETARGVGQSTESAVKPLIFQAHQSGELRVQGSTTHTLSAFMGTGGNNTPLMVEPTVFVKSKRAQSDQDDETWKEDGPHPTVNQFDVGDSRTVATVVESDVPALVTMREGVTGSGGRGPLVKYDMSLTLATGNNQTLFHNQSVRRLTPMECERLQGFPDGWTEGQADSHRYKQMGNAVAVPVVQWIIRNLVKVEND